MDQTYLFSSAYMTHFMQCRGIIQVGIFFPAVEKDTVITQQRVGACVFTAAGSFVPSGLCIRASNYMASLETDSQVAFTSFFKGLM